MKIHAGIYLLVLAGCLTAISCGVREQRDISPALDASLNLILVSDQNSGNCARSYRAGTELGRFSCSRAPRASCRVDGLQGLTAEVIVSSGTQTRLFQELNQLVDAFPTCSTARVAAFALTSFQTTTADENTNARAYNSLSVVNDCATLGNSNIDKLATRTQYDFFLSARGVLARQARLLNETACTDAMNLTPDERAWLETFAAGDLLLETTCLYGTSALIGLCSDAEKAAAFAFDFATPL